MLNQIYQEIIQDHYHYPRNRGTLESPDFESTILNLSCGDSMSIQGIIVDGKVAKVAFQGKGCVISQAAASLLSEKILHKTIAEIKNLTKDDILAILGIPLGPTRLRCALLSLEAFQMGLQIYAKSCKNS